MSRKMWDNTNTLNPYVLAPVEVQPGDMLGYKIVVSVAESFQGWCAFKGPTSWDDEQVKMHGDEIDQRIAEGLFPVLKGHGRYGNG